MLADRAGPERSAMIQNYMAASRRRALGITCQPAAGASDGITYHGRLGGAPLLPAGFRWPKDRTGAAMLFIAQFDLRCLDQVDVNCPKEGLLSVFRSQEILTMSPKDRQAFHISYLPQFDNAELQEKHPHLTAGLGEGSLAGPSLGSELTAWAARTEPVWTVSEQLEDLACQCHLSPIEAAQLETWAQSFNRLNGGNSLLFADNLAGLAEQKEVCAFAASGISYSPARARDRHYSHLLEDAPNWMLVAKIDEGRLFNNYDDNSGKDRRRVAETRLLIRRADLELGLFERGWLICQKAPGAAPPDQ